MSDVPVGRPTDYRPEFCDKAIELAREGCGKAEIALELGTSRPTLDAWTEKHPDFLYAMTQARELAAGWWEAQGRKGIWSREFNANAYRLQVMNRFPDDWRDKTTQEVTGKDGGPVQVQRIERIIVDPQNRDA